MPSFFVIKNQTKIRQFSILLAFLFGTMVQTVSAQNCTGSDICVVDGQTSLIREFKTGTSTFTVEAGGIVTQGAGDAVLRGVSSITVLPNGRISSETGNVLQIGSNNDALGGGILTSLNNAGTISGSSNLVIQFYQGITITTLTNSGTIQANSGSATIRNSEQSTITTLTNTGKIDVGTGGTAILNESGSSIGTLNNSGQILGGSTLIYNDATSTIGNINNIHNTAQMTATDAGTDTAIAISNIGTITSINNTDGATLTATQTGTGAAVVINNLGTINTITNDATSTMTATANTQAAVIYNTGTIGSIVNLGTMTATAPASAGIDNNGGVISTLNNLQGAGNAAGPLTYSGILPTNYNVIINSTSNYGKLVASSVGSSSLRFNIYGNTGTTLVPGVAASTLTNGTYSAVLSGLSASNIAPSTLSGTYSGGLSWALSNTSGTVWDLIVTSGSSSGGDANSGGNSSATAETTSVNTATVSSSNNITVPVIAGGSVNVSQLSATTPTVLAGGTLVLNNGDSYAGAITIASSGGVMTSSAKGTSVLTGTLSGAGGLTLTGSGTIVLTAQNTYSGGTVVSSGTLVVAGSSPTGIGDVVVSNAATMMGTGSITGNLSVSGVLKPGNSPGYLAATNNLTLNSGSVYQQDIAGTTQASSTSPVGATGYYSFMNVGGQLTINSGATLTPTLQNLFQTTESGYGSASYVPNLGDTFRIVTALGGISGAFTSVSQPAGLASGTQFIPFYNYAGSNSIDLAVIPTSYSTTLANSSRNSLSVASALDRLSAAQFAGTATTTQSNLMFATATQTLSSLPSFSQALAGEVYGAALVTVPQATLRTQSAVMAKLGEKGLGVAPRMNSPIINPTGVTAQNPMGEPNASVSTNPTVNPTEDLAIPYRPNVWGEIAYQYGSRSSDSNASGYNSSLYQAVFGTDLYQENGIKAGVGFTLSTTGLSNNNGSGTVGQESIFVYGKLPVFENYVLDGMASFGMSNTSVTRNDPTSSASLKGKNILGNDALLSLGISRPVEVSDYNLIFTPYARVTWQMVNQSPFDEGTASVAALSVNGYSGNGVRGVIGLSAGSLNKDPMVDDYTYSVNLAVGADTNTLINPTLTANLAGFGTNIYTANVGSVFVQAGLRGTAKVANSAYAYAGITGETRTGQSLGVVNVGLMAQF